MKELSLVIRGEQGATREEEWFRKLFTKLSDALNKSQ